MRSDIPRIRCYGKMGDHIYCLVGGSAVKEARFSIKQRYLSLLPLFEAQDQVISVTADKEGEGPKCDYFPRRFGRHFRNHRHRLITEFVLEAVGKADFDLSLPWLKADPKPIAPVVINRTPRWRDLPKLNYEAVQDQDCIFIGSEQEHDAFTRDFWEIKRHQVSDLMEAARILSGADLFLGNQSSLFAIAEGLKVPRCLEEFYWIPNCTPQSRNGHTYCNPELVRHYLS